MKKYRICAIKGVNLRQYPTYEAKILDVIPTGSIVESSSSVKEWIRILYKNKTGWVNKNYVLEVS